MARLRTFAPVPHSPATNQHWWTEAVVYQIYVRSFADSDGDGIGDLDGIRARLDHLVELGVDAFWLNPCYPSPQLDHGYDVADYTDIEPDYGDLATYDRLVTEATARGLRVVMDVVPNHCSSEHPWFRAALAAPRGSSERARFYFRDGRNGGTDPPNNWHAVFGGSAWTPVGDGQWYLGTFTPHQPDFDHTCRDVEELFAGALRFWFDRGADGFRVDAVTPVGKAAELPDAPPAPEGLRETDVAFQNPYTTFRPEGHDVWRRWRRTIDDYMAEHPDRDLMMVAEAYTPRRPDLLMEFARPDEFHQCFSFDLLLNPWDAASIRQAIGDQLLLLDERQIVPTWTLNNHDCQRIVTRLGRADATEPHSYSGNPMVYTDAPVDEHVGRRRARAQIAMLLALPGSVYLYQGEELGLPEVLDLPADARQDPVFARTGGAEIGRDGCRVPIPWTTDPAGSHGFSPPHGNAPPWLPQPEGWGGLALDAQRGVAGSMFEHYRELLALRRRLAVPQGASAELVDVGDGLVGVRRGDLLAVLNPTAEARAADGTAGMQVVVSSAPLDGEPSGDVVVPADSAVWLLGARR